MFKHIPLYFFPPLSSHELLSSSFSLFFFFLSRAPLSLFLFFFFSSHKNTRIHDQYMLFILKIKGNDLTSFFFITWQPCLERETEILGKNGEEGGGTKEKERKKKKNEEK